MIKFEDLSLTFSEMSSTNHPSPPCLYVEVPRFGTQAWEGMKGRGTKFQTKLVLSTPLRARGSPSGAEPEPAATLILPPAFAEAASRRQASKGEGIIWEISNIFASNLLGVWNLVI